jgi:phasin family protein
MTTNKAKIVEVAPAAEQMASRSIEATVSDLKEGAAKATAGFEATQAKMKEGVEKAMKTAEEFVAFSQGNLEAMMKSSQIWAAGVQDLSKHMAAAAQASLDESMSAFKALTSVKSLKDAFELQSTFARAALEKSLAESGKLTDASFKLTEQTLAPITARVTVAVEKFAKAA